MWISVYNIVKYTGIEGKIMRHLSYLDYQGMARDNHYSDLVCAQN